MNSEQTAKPPTLEMSRKTSTVSLEKSEAGEVNIFNVTIETAITHLPHFESFARGETDFNRDSTDPA